MQTISLAEAVKLKSVLTKKVRELEEELHRVAYTTIEKGDSISTPVRTVSAVEAELQEVRKDARTLDRLMYKANSENTISFKNETVPLVEAIEWATQLRAEARLCKEMGASSKEEIQYGYAENTTVYKVALFEPEDYRQKAIQLEREAHKLSNLINAKNYTVTIAFNDEKYF
ncbi:hypothetical protein [Domibacillus sp.]|uniref:hypothetical protein n=1 Tax=Domibacillus sp. TaxID=1969783 RepID=UPI00281280EF|nr:hypothetical protein [Domibacillus sp.]